MDELLAKAAEAMNMPEAMVRRSAEARAKAEGKDIEEVLADWAGVDAPAGEEPDDAEAPPEGEADVEEADAAEAAPAEAEPAAAPEKKEAAGIDVFVEAAAEKMKMPPSMIRRSAEARARAEGRTYEEVLADWAQVDVAEVKEASAEPEPTEPEDAEAAPAAEAEEDTGPDEEPDEAPDEEPTEEPAEEADEGPTVEVIGGEDAVTAEPEPEPVDEDGDEAEGELVAAGLPTWLMALFVIVPAFAIAYAAFFPNGPNCGDAGRLAVDRVTGLAVECDGSPYGERAVDFFAMGAELYAPCSACHGPGGSGTAAGPPFTGGALVATFPEGSCEVHVEWVRVGTAGWPDPTYGVTDKPVGGFGVSVMPGFGDFLTEEELRSVVLYERVQFGGEPLDVALADCGLVDDEDADAATDE